jgi:hypothetical protein
MIATAQARPDRSVVFTDLHDLVTLQIESLLENLSSSSLEARRQITRELHIEPRPEELQSIVRIAEDESTQPLRGEIPRRLLAVRVLALREATKLYEMSPLRPESVEKLARLFPDLLEEARKMESMLGDSVAVESGLSIDDRDYLMKIGRAFVCSREELVAASQLASRLATLSRAVIEGDLEIHTPSLKASDRMALAASINGDEDGTLSRRVIDALAMRSLIDGQLIRWSQMGLPSEDETLRRAQRDALLEQMRRARICIESLADRLQKSQDEALVAGVQSLAEECRAAGRGLFSVKLRLAKVLRAPYDDVSAEQAEAEEIDSIEKMIGDSLASEASEKGVPRAQSEEEVYLGALQEMRDKRKKVAGERPNESVLRLKRDRRRMRIMVASVFVLAIVSAIVNFVVLAPESTGPIAPPVTELSPHSNASRVEAAGPVLFTHVKDWNGLDETTRKSQVEKIGSMVGPDGFTGMLIIDEYGEIAGAWHEDSGAALVEKP